MGYFYDANGNMTSGNGRTINWYSFNKPYSIAKGTTTSTFMYGPDRARIQQMVSTGASIKMVKYLGTLYEKVTETAIYGCPLIVSNCFLRLNPLDQLQEPDAETGAGEQDEADEPEG